MTNISSDLDPIFAQLAKSRFRSRFCLGQKEGDYFASRGRTVILDHARDFVLARLAPTNPLNDGEQTPMRGHPVFIAQHATATCCRSCMAKWHGIPRNQPLGEGEQAYAVAVIARWFDYGLAPTPRSDERGGNGDPRQ